MQELQETLIQEKLHPSRIPLGYIETKKDLIDWKTFVGFPSYIDAKSDSEVCGLKPALEGKNVSMITGAFADRLITDSSGKRVVAVETVIDNKKYSITADHFALCAGAFQSPLLLLKSKNASHPNGLANSSGLVGKNLMLHNITGVISAHPFRKNSCEMQKTLNIFDYYWGEPNWTYPMGTIQLVGHMPIESQMPYGLKWFGRCILNHSIQLMVMSEDLPLPTNAISLTTDGKFTIHYQHNNVESHHRLVNYAKKIFRKAAYPFNISGFFTRKNLPMTHACGTLRFGDDPKTSVLNTYSQSHDVSNLFVVDSCFFPSSAAVNPALTIMAQALRVADYFKRRHS